MSVNWMYWQFSVRKFYGFFFFLKVQNNPLVIVSTICVSILCEKLVSEDLTINVTCKAVMQRRIGYESSTETCKSHIKLYKVPVTVSYWHWGPEISFNSIFKNAVNIRRQHCTLTLLRFPLCKPLAQTRAQTRQWQRIKCIIRPLWLKVTSYITHLVVQMNNWPFDKFSCLL